MNERNNQTSNKRAIHEKITKEIVAVTRVYISHKTRGFSQNFYLDFLGLYNIYTENSFIKKQTRWV